MTVRETKGSAPSREAALAAGVVDPSYRDKIARARRQPPSDKLLAGLRLFEQGLELTRLDVARRLGTSEPRAVEAALRARVDRVRQVRDVGLYQRLVTGAPSMSDS